MEVLKKFCQCCNRKRDLKYWRKELPCCDECERLREENHEPDEDIEELTDDGWKDYY